MISWLLYTNLTTSPYTKSKCTSTCYAQTQLEDPISSMEISPLSLSSSTSFGVLDILPMEVQQTIFGFLPEHTLCWINLVCKQWYRMATDDYLWRGRYFSSMRDSSLDTNTNRANSTKTPWKYAYYSKIGSLLFWGGVNNNTLAQIKASRYVEFSSISCGKSNFFYAMSDDNIYGFGNGSSGELKMAIINTWNSTFKLECGWEHAVLTNAYGNMWVCGGSGYYQTGVNSTLPIRNPQSLYLFGETTAQVSCGKYHTVFLTENGHVYGCGDNGCHQLGLICTYQYTPVRLPLMEKIPTPIQKIVCGAYSTFIITTTGNLYALGSNSSGQLGIGNTQSQSTPQLVKFYANNSLDMENRGPEVRVNIVQVVCGTAHTIALSDTGELYSWGYNQMGQCGLGHNKLCTIPQKVTTFPKPVRIIKLACGDAHSVVLTADKEVFGFGNNLNGQIGEGKFEYLEPKRMFAPRGVVDDIACCENFTVGLVARPNSNNNNNAQAR